jgi:phosphatidylglycerophosphate synthase
MIDNPFRAYLVRHAKPLVRLYTALRLTPNMISATSVAIAAVAALLCAKGLAWPAIGVWWLGRLLDGTDGIYARATGQATHFGAYVDIVCDMAAYSLMVLGFQHLHPELAPDWTAMLFLYVLCIASAPGHPGTRRGG